MEFFFSEMITIRSFEKTINFMFQINTEGKGPRLEEHDSAEYGHII